MIKELDEYSYEELWGLSQELLDQFDEDKLIKRLTEEPNYTIAQVKMCNCVTVEKH